MASTGSNSSSAFVLLRLLVLALALSPATAFMPPAATPAPGNGANAPGQQPPQTPRTGGSVKGHTPLCQSIDPIHPSHASHAFSTFPFEAGPSAVGRPELVAPADLVKMQAAAVRVV